MGSVRSEKEFAESEEMERDSAESEKSSSSSESTDDSDTDDCSDMDLESVERKRSEALEIWNDIERRFEVVKDQLYKERMAQAKVKLEEIHEGIAKEYTDPLEQLKKAMEERIEVAGILKMKRLESIRICHEAEELASGQNLKNDKLLLFEAIEENVKEKLRCLEEERNSVAFDSILSKERSRRGKGKGIWKRKGPDSNRRKPVTVSWPYIVYMLRDEEIMEDWSIARKLLASG